MTQPRQEKPREEGKTPHARSVDARAADNGKGLVQLARILHPSRGKEAVFVSIEIKIAVAVTALVVTMSLILGMIGQLADQSLVIKTQLLAALFSVVAALALARCMSRPIRSLIRAARRVAEGDLTVRIPWDRNDEIGLLANGFNFMMEQFERQQHRLEKVVSQRTLELERTNLELEEARREAEELARTDSLTGLANRRAMNERFDDLIAEAERGRRLSLILLDLDHFKAVNDENGHDAGDEVLREVARILQRRTRRMDTVARFGGEEMAVLLPDAGRGDARSVAETLRQAIEDARPAELFVTASFGVAVFGGRLRDRQSLVRAADVALYRAKASGRNRVVLASPFLAPESVATGAGEVA